MKLGDICEVVTGSTPKTGVSEYWDGDIKWITPAELTDETFIVTDSVRKITESAVKRTGLSTIPKGAVILSSRAPIGKVAIAGCDLYCNQGFKNFICSKAILNEYLYWFLKGKKEYLNSLGRGATFKEISKDIVQNIEIEVPDIKRQREIAMILKKCNNIITKWKKEINELNKLVQARFVEMFGKCKNMVPIEDLCLIITDGTHQPPKFQEKGIPFIFVSNLTDNKITYEAEKFISDETYAELIMRTPIEKGDILLSTVGSYGHPAVVTEDRRFLFQRHIAYLKPKHELINSFYLHGALLAPDSQRQIDERVKGIAQKTLNLSEIRKIIIPVPNLEQQKCYEDFAHQVDKSKVAIQKSLDEMQLLFDSLMQEYFG